MAGTKTGKSNKDSKANEANNTNNANKDSADKCSTGKNNTHSVAASLSYNEAHTALELALAQLQASDLPVEEMAGLYQRAQSYAERCQQLLAQVEQTIEIWDPQEPASSPQTYAAE